ncbi:hypothetical protein STEG23_037695, partial [Scotinomys teguina]
MTGRVLWQQEGSVCVDDVDGMKLITVVSYPSSTHQSANESAKNQQTIETASCLQSGSGEGASESFAIKVTYVSTERSIITSVIDPMNETVTLKAASETSMFEKTRENEAGMFPAATRKETSTDDSINCDSLMLDGNRSNL